MSTGRMPYAFSSRTREASIEGGRFLRELRGSIALGKLAQLLGQFWNKVSRSILMT